MVTLEAKARNSKEGLDTLRKGGFMPAVFYGKKKESTPITISRTEFLKVWKEAGESTVVVLKTSEGELNTLIHDVDFDPVTSVPRHADFYVFDKDKKLEISVPLEFIGVAGGVKDLGGMLVKALHEIKIEALPQDLPHQIEVDISLLVEIGSQIHAKDIVMPKGVTLLENPEEVVALIAEQKVEEEIPVEPIDLSAIEVEKKGKQDEEGGEGEGAKGEKAEPQN